MIGLDNLFLSSKKKNFIASIDSISVSTFSTKLFYGDKAGFDLEFKKEKEEILPLCLDNGSTRNRENNCTTWTIAEDKT